MSNIQLTLIPTPDNFQLLDIFIGGNGNAEPQDLAELQLPPIDGRQGVLLNGKAPVWLYAYLVHQCHAAVTLINGQVSRPFSMQTKPDQTPPNVLLGAEIREKSRQRYARSRDEVRQEIDDSLEPTTTSPASILDWQ